MSSCVFPSSPGAYPPPSSHCLAVGLRAAIISFGIVHAAARRAPCARPPADRHRLATSSPPLSFPPAVYPSADCRTLHHHPYSRIHSAAVSHCLPTSPPSTPLKTAQNRPFCKRIQPPRLSIAADRAPEDLLKIPSASSPANSWHAKTGAGHIVRLPLLIPFCPPRLRCHP